MFRIVVLFIVSRGTRTDGYDAQFCLSYPSDDLKSRLINNLTPDGKELD